ncbi:hypothetical protein EEB14_25640 [Rhodococcus sp. WS4]|nr:hypothetical protein EEB14_25640 [Rhodococcus sp. WS4]
MLVASEPDDVADACRRLLADPISATTTEHALEWLPEMFGNASATGADMAGKAEEGVGNPTQVSIKPALHATELLDTPPVSAGPTPVVVVEARTATSREPRWSAGNRCRVVARWSEFRARYATTVSSHECWTIAPAAS